MKFYTAYYRQKGEKEVSLLLQQVRLKDRGGRREESVVLAAVSTGETAPDLGKELKDWFHSCALIQCRKKKRRALGGLARELTAILGRKEYVKAGVAGILCFEERCLLFGFGSPRIYLLRERFLRPSVESVLKQKQEPFCREGVLEPGARILVATESFCREDRKEQIISCLGSGQIAGDRQASRRLEELGMHVQEKQEGRAAVFLVSGS
ncbi:MAG: hypothetical protein J6C84_09785 [Lachnospiraceae bacterium]|nr:hypothetical protein [Lachnospiraceae bacterium]